MSVYSLVLHGRCPIPVSLDSLPLPPPIYPNTKKLQGLNVYLKIKFLSQELKALCSGLELGRGEGKTERKEERAKKSRK